MKKLIQLSGLALLLALPIGCSQVNPVSPQAASTPEPTSTGPAIAAQWNNGMSSPLGVAVGPSGEIYVTDGNAVLRFASQGAVPTTWTAGAQGTFNRPYGLAITSDGLFVGDSGNRRIQKVGLNGAPVALSTAYTTPSFTYPMGIGVGPDGDLHVADINGRIWRIDAVSGAVALGGEGLLAGQFTYPIGVAFQQDNVLVADYQANKMVKFDLGVGSLSSWGSIGSDPGMFLNPTDIKVMANGNICVVDSGNNRIQEFGPSGNFLRQWGNSGPTAERLSQPMGMAVQGNDLYVVDSGNRRIVKYQL